MRRVGRILGIVLVCAAPVHGYPARADGPEPVLEAASETVPETAAEAAPEAAPEPASETVPEPASEPAPGLRLGVAKGCGDAAAADDLARALEMRLGTAVRVTEGRADASELVWRAEAERCVVRSVFDPDETAVALGPEPTRDEIRAAASRIAFVLNSPAPDEREAVTGAEPTLGPMAAEHELRPAPDSLPATDPQPARTSAPTSPERFPVPAAPGTWRLSVVPGLATYGSHPPDTMPSLSLNLIAGRSRGVAGLELGLVSNAVHETLYGVQAAAVVNHVGRKMQGVQVSGVANVNGGETHGLQLAGIANVAMARLDGVQFSTGVNYTATASRGIQLGTLNLAGDFQGVQAGGINLAGEVEGLQIGVVNVSRGVDAPIGLVNVVRTEPLLLTGGLSSGRFASVGFKHGGRRLRYLYLAGLHLSADVSPFGFGFGASLHSPMGRYFFDLETIAWQMVSPDPMALGAMYEVRAVAGWQITRRVAIQVGPTVKALVAPTRDGFLLPPAWAVSETLPEGRTAWIWPELHLGVSF